MTEQPCWFPYELLSELFEQCLSMLFTCCLMQTLTHVSSFAHVSISIQMLQLIDFQRNSAACIFN